MSFVELQVELTIWWEHNSSVSNIKPVVILCRDPAADKYWLWHLISLEDVISQMREHVELQHEILTNFLLC